MMVCWSCEGTEPALGSGTAESLLSVFVWSRDLKAASPVTHTTGSFLVFTLICYILQGKNVEDYSKYRTTSQFVQF